jgi:ribonuclease J
VLPVHGEWRHLKANADLAISTGVHPDRALIAEDGSVIDLVDGIATITGQVQASLVFVDAMTVGGATEESLTVRRNLAEEGVVTIVALADPDTGKLTEKPDFLAHGFEHDESTFDSAVPVIQRVLTKASKDDIDVEQTEELIKQAVSTWAHRTYRRSPLIIPVVIDA